MPICRQPRRSSRRRHRIGQRSVPPRRRHRSSPCRKGKSDDLKKIDGVGPALERKLNALGVTRFDQIAGFSDEEVGKVDDALNYKGRVTRDDWVGQAKALAAG